MEYFANVILNIRLESIPETVKMERICDTADPSINDNRFNGRFLIRESVVRSKTLPELLVNAESTNAFGQTGEMN